MCNGLDASQYRLPVEIGNYNEWHGGAGLQKYRMFYLYLKDVALLVKVPTLLFFLTRSILTEFRLMLVPVLKHLTDNFSIIEAPLCVHLF